MTHDYDEYLKSQHWRTISRLVRERDGNRCVVCGEDSHTEVHHRDYTGYPYGEAMNDLYTLCRECHEWAGKRMKAKESTTGKPRKRRVSLTRFGGGGG